MINFLKAPFQGLSNLLGKRSKSLFWASALGIGIILLAACGGDGLDGADQALFAKALGEEMRDEGYGSLIRVNAKQAELAEMSGLKVEDVASAMSGLQTSLVGEYALDVNFALTKDLFGAITGSEKLTSLAGDKLSNWLLEQGKDQLKSKLEDFLKDQTQGALKDLLRQGLDDKVDLGYFESAGTFWFWNSETGEYITATFMDYNGQPLMVVTTGAAKKGKHPEYGWTVFEEFTINKVSMVKDDGSGEDGEDDESQGQVSNPAQEPVSGQCCKPGRSRLQVVSSIDPNDMLSDPDGFGEQSYIPLDQVINYTIRFENMESALASAFDITVIAQLDPGLDLSSVLAGSSSHPDVMTVQVDESNNTITWFFKDIMLPPNKEPPQGEGWVRFSVRPKLDLPSGAPLTAKAAIRFDFNPPIETNEVVYTIDASPPETRIGNLPSVQLMPSFEVPWEGSDGGNTSGIQSVTVLVSENGGPFEAIGATAGPSIPFQGEPGSVYGFATVGIDQVGNPEAAPERPDVTVIVGQPLSLEPGLHLLGVPVAPGESFRGSLASLDTLWSVWDPPSQTYLSSVYRDAPWPVAGNKVPGYGLWAQVDDEATVYITGQPAPQDQPYSIGLETGWNLIANPYTSAIPWSLDAIRVKAGGEEKTLREAQALGWVEDFVWGWDGETYSLVYDSSIVPGMASDLQPFRGYWIQAHRDSTLVLPPPV